MVNFNFKQLSEMRVNELTTGYKKIEKTPSVMAIKFLRFIAMHTFKQKLIFDLKRGKIFKRTISQDDKIRCNYWKVKDPFIKEYNYGVIKL